VISSRASLVGRKISVPYHVIFEDSSGCTCESIVRDRSSRGYLVTLAGEQLWKTETFIRRWLCSDEAAEELADDLFATCSLSTLEMVPSGVLSRVPTALEALDTQSGQEVQFSEDSP